MSDRPAFNDACLPLPSAEERAFRRLRGRLLWRMAHHACAEARLRTVLIVLLSLVLWGILFAVAWDGFRFLRDTIPSRELYEQIVRVAFGMFFAALFVMLVFSAAILLYGSLFCGRETQFLLALPARVERVFAYRFQEALVLSSWGFLLLGSPVLAAYGLAASAPWGYYVLMPFYLVAFVYTPAALGAIACLAVVHRLTRRRLSVTVAGAAGLAALVGALGWMALGGRAYRLRVCPRSVYQPGVQHVHHLRVPGGHGRRGGLGRRRLQPHGRSYLERAAHHLAEPERPRGARGH